MLFRIEYQHTDRDPYFGRQPLGGAIEGIGRIRLLRSMGSHNQFALIIRYPSLDDTVHQCIRIVVAKYITEAEICVEYPFFAESPLVTTNSAKIKPVTFSRSIFEKAASAAEIRLGHIERQYTAMYSCVPSAVPLLEIIPVFIIEYSDKHRFADPIVPD